MEVCGETAQLRCVNPAHALKCKADRGLPDQQPRRSQAERALPFKTIREFTMQRAHIGWMASVGGAATLFCGLLAIDPQLRRQAASLASGQPTGELIELNFRAQNLFLGTMVYLKDYSLENSTLAMFAVAGLVLVIVMLRS